MQSRTLFFSLLLPLFLAGGLVTAEAQSIKKLSGEPLEIKTLNGHIQHLLDSLEMAGLSVGIINDAELVYHEVFGVQNRTSGVPVNRETIFEGASLSKPIFAYFALKMAEKGILDLDRPLHQYMPHPAIAEDSQEDYQLITARMVLSHSAGFPNHSNGQQIELPFKPGAGFRYSGEAYQYLAAIIGQLHGVGWKAEFNKIFEREVSRQLGMEHTSFLWNDYLAAHKAYGHKDGEPTHNDTGGWSGKTFNAFSSIHSEASEYAKFLIAMLKGTGLKPETRDEMLREHNHFAEDEPMRQETGQTGWGLGFAQKPTPYGLMHLHTGNNHSFQAYAMIVPEQQYGLVIFCNSDQLLPFLEGLEQILGEQF
ncbi:serine hydrolase domain-containing protein [Flavilitoribacter nigricans]|uniref:Serine hydrolase n=1 Tax=Flavilitoribacter nigricans (strain ATCC 23147 / DSM 23189 / NBRC 102662 / NCIMB 1420 / SS-2) TaxID=1122177 RepID=A0A2D0N4N5_FLAN2|nr:serine hydrolase domain-containing protein [Flavilitoribacter nigricans]PHN03481.1 serine hydrolase [Flavilitoribacter nigricans DSM 23189 = NBRC 102662]